MLVSIDSRTSLFLKTNRIVCIRALQLIHLCFFNFLWLIPSGPDALFSLRLLKMSETSDGLISIFDKEEFVLLVNSGRLEFVSSIEVMEQK